MLDLLKDLLPGIVGKTDSALVVWMLICIGYLAWQNYRQKQEYREEISQYKETLEKLQGALNSKNGEERENLLGIIEKYHQSQIGIREAISEVKSVLSTLAILSRRES